MTMPWFKVFPEARNDAKLESLTDAQHRVWFKLMCFASEQTARGTITGYDDLDLLAVEVARGDTELLRQTLTRLVKLRIVAWSEEAGTTEFINFAKRQARKASDDKEAIKQRVTKYRQNKRNAQTVSNKEEKRDVTRYNENVTPLDIDIEEDIDKDSSVQTNKEAKEQTGVVKERGVAVASDTPPTSKPPRAISFPDSFRVTAEMEVWAAKHVPELDIGIATEEWETGMRSNRTKYKYTDWTQAWYNAMRLAAKWAAERKSKNGHALSQNRGATNGTGQPADKWSRASGEQIRFAKGTLASEGNR